MMGIFDMFRKKKKDPVQQESGHRTDVEVQAANMSKPAAADPATETPEPASMLLGFALLNSAEYDVEQLVRTMQTDWSIQVDGLEAGENMVFQLGGMNIAVAYMPGPIPNQEVESNCKYNVLWPEAEQVVATHQAHVIITVMNITDPLIGHALFTQITSSVLKLNNAIAYYSPPMVMSAESYIESARMLQDQELPVQLWVFLGLYRSEDGGGSSSYTIGLKHFGKDEIEIVDSREEMADVFEFTLNIVSYIVGSDVTFRDGETIGFAEDHKLQLTRSPAVAMEGYSIKIGY
ncbi:DUF4261 domain-containing protein [Paenibacillus sp. Z6-24]